MDKRVLKKFRNGQVVYDFNPADETPDSEHVNEGWGIVQKEKGLTYDTAKNKAMRRAEELSESCGYQVYTPCPEFTQTHVHRVSDAIQPSHPLSSPSSCPQSLPASESFPMSPLFA